MSCDTLVTPSLQPGLAELGAAREVIRLADVLVMNFCRCTPLISVPQPLPAAQNMTARRLARIGATMIHVIVELLDELAHGIPDLHGAACRGHAQLFDVADRHDHQAVAQAKGSAPKRTE
jgi:hypothetical protein